MDIFRASVLVAAVVVASVAASPQDLRTRCKAQKDPIACVKFRALDFLKEASAEDVLQVAEGVEVVRSRGAARGAKSLGEGQDEDLLGALENFVDEHELKLRLPWTSSSLTVSPRALDSNTLSLTLDDDTENTVEPKSRRKSKLKKLLVPLLVFVLLKAMTLIPLALGVLGLKAWNALQLSFFSFVTSLALAIFQLCKKVASDSAAVPVAHTAWDPYHYAARNLFLGQEEAAQELAYSGYPAASQ